MGNQDYKPISSLAIVAFVVALTSLAGFLAIPFIILAVIAMPFALIAARRIRAYDMHGFRYAMGGLGVAFISLVLAPVWHFVQYNSEALSQHERVDFAAISGKQDVLDQFANQQICLKGYLVPADSRPHTRSFCLSPDGNDRDLEQAITVDLPIGWAYDGSPVAISGTLEVRRNYANQADRYLFRAAAIRAAKTPYGLAHRATGEGC